MKYLYTLLAITCLIGVIFSIIKGDDSGFKYYMTITLICSGIASILEEIKGSNEETIVRDPKTGRFKKKC